MNHWFTCYEGWKFKKRKQRLLKTRKEERNIELSGFHDQLAINALDSKMNREQLPLNER